MFETVSVAVGAVLGVVLAASQAFQPKSFVDLLQPLIFVVLIGLITINIHATRDSLKYRKQAREALKQAREDLNQAQRALDQAPAALKQARLMHVQDVERDSHELELEIGEFHNYFLYSVGMFGIMELVIIGVYTPLLSEGVSKHFKDFSYAWLFALVTTLWYLFAIVTTLYDRG